MHQRRPQNGHAQDRSGDEADGLRRDRGPREAIDQPDQRAEREEEQEEGNGEEFPTKARAASTAQKTMSRFSKSVSSSKFYTSPDHSDAPS